MFEKTALDCKMCQSMLHLIAQESSHHLHVEVLQEVRKTPSVLRSSGFEVFRVQGSDKLNLVAYADQAEHCMDQMDADEQLHECLKSQNLQRFFDGERWFCFIPVQRKKRSQDIWVVEFSDSVNETSLHSIAMLVKVYQHCDAHISSNKYDTLTGLENRKALTERLSRILRSKNRSSRRTEDRGCLPSLCVLDIDFFKRVNDDFGHLYGDEVLLLLASLMKATFREHDFLYRYGGEEFVALVDTHSESETTSALERFRKAVDDYAFPQVGHITVSIGFVRLQAGVLPSSLFDHADKALYYAKQHGRNRVCSYHQLLEAGLVNDEKVRIENELF